MSIPEIVVNVEKRVCVKDELFIGKEISRLTKRVDGSICMHTVHNWIKMSFENHDTYVRRAKNEKEAEEIHIQYMIPVNKFLLLKEVLFKDLPVVAGGRIGSYQYLVKVMKEV